MMAEKMSGSGAPESDPRAVVQRFLAACSAFDFDAAVAFIDEHCVYQNVPFHTARGRERIRRDLGLMARAMTTFEVDLVNVAVDGDVVLTERIDTLGGRFFRAELPLMGAFVVREGRITQWRDYFDWTSAAGKMGGSVLTRWFR